MGGWYIVTKRIKGRAYLYRQRSWREGRRVRVRSEYLGPAKPARAPLEATEAVGLWQSGDLCELRADDLSEREFDAVRLYTGEAYKQTNRVLRGDRPMTEGEAEESAALLSALMHPKARLKHDLVLYRRALVPEDVGPGDAIADLGFMSCSVDLASAKAHICHPEKGFKRVILRIEANRGAQGYIAPVGMTAYPKEKEILRYGGYFIITSIVEYDGDLIYYIRDDGGYEIK